MDKMIETSGIISNGKIKFSVPISKVDTEKRMVHGFATLDNVDCQGDIVPAEASIRAFENFRGNIREMHDPLKAVGKMVSFRPEKYYDPSTGKVYRGVFVSAYVSKGAQDTWEKVLDGTLTGFSIGGNVEKASDSIDNGELLRVIEEYSLTELSLVDNPANQFANVISVEKSSDGGYLSKTSAENVFWCKKDNTVQITSSTSTNCYHCDGIMQNIGFVESNDMDKMSVVKDLLSVAKNVPTENDIVDFDEGIGRVESIITKGNVRLDTAIDELIASENDPVVVIEVLIKNNDTMVSANRRILKNISSITKTKEKEVENVESPVTDVTVVDEVIEKSADAAVEDVVSDEAEAVEAVEAEVDAVDEVAEGVAEEAVEKSEDEAPVIEEAFDLSKRFDEIESVLKSLTEVLAPLAEMVKSLSATTKESSDAVSVLTEELATTKSIVSAMQSETEGFGKRVDAVESTTAFRKSADLGEIVQEQPKAASKWGGRILDTTYFN